MKKMFLPVLFSALMLNGIAQEATPIISDSTKGFRFTTIDSIAITPVKDQNRSGTCWSYSTLGFLESELIRMGKGVYDLSEMFVVHHTMLDRAEYVVRMYGNAQFAPGGSAYDVIYCLKNYGLVPQEVMPGIQYGSTPADTLPVHTELDAVAGGVVDAIVNSKLKKLGFKHKNLIHYYCEDIKCSYWRYEFDDGSNDGINGGLYLAYLFLGRAGGEIIIALALFPFDMVHT